MGVGNETARYRFDTFTLDLARGIVLDREGGELTLRPKSFALLRHMVEHAGRVVTREELMEAVWPGVFVTDDNITQCIKEVRRAIGDEAQQLLRTLPRRGYLMVPPVARGEAALVVAPAAQTSSASEEALPAPPRGRPMLVVLPFENIGDDEEQRYFADGLTADLVTDLTRFQSLHVVSPVRRGPAGRSLPETPWTPEALPGTASYLVSGSVRRAGGRIRATAQLEDARSGVNLWAERFDRPLDDLFEVQAELADRIASGLASRVDYEALRRAKRRPPASLDAYDLVLRARELIGRANRADTLAAREMITRALAADPDYATAHAWHAWAVSRGFTQRWGEPKGRPAVTLALQHAMRSVELEPDLPLCLAHLAYILMLDRRFDEALQAAHRAVALNPCAYESRTAAGIVLVNIGEPEAAVREFRLAMELDPYYPPVVRAWLGKAFLFSNDPEAALVELRWAIARVPDYSNALQPLAVAAAETGRVEEARAAVAALHRVLPGLTLRDVEATLWMRQDADVKRMLGGLRAAGLPEG
ncbi:winged helix-turn-helix domain-containing tetratricopeptide repeat protein [Elioraea sp.]|uniref:winged helix-turn-helix domain-containing tetratricopeptide repeat protein n=1 Tax=Elioraea sp. TaxID=2185103 RepID=UPI003F712FD0